MNRETRANSDGGPGTWIPRISRAALVAVAVISCGDDESRKSCSITPPQSAPPVNLSCHPAPTSTTGKCLVDDQICQFKKDISTMSDVRNGLGEPQETPAPNAFEYDCEQVGRDEVLHHDVVVFWFKS